MPLVRVEFISKRYLKEKDRISSIIHNALTTFLNSNINDLRIRYNRLKKGNFVLLGRSNDYLFIEILLMKGRTKNQKKELFKNIAVKLKDEFSVLDNDLTIFINEQPKENWGIRGGLQASEFL